MKKLACIVEQLYSELNIQQTIAQPALTENKFLSTTLSRLLKGDRPRSLEELDELYDNR